MTVKGIEGRSSGESSKMSIKKSAISRLDHYTKKMVHRAGKNIEAARQVQTIDPATVTMGTAVEVRKDTPVALPEQATVSKELSPQQIAGAVVVTVQEKSEKTTLDNFVNSLVQEQISLPSERKVEQVSLARRRFDPVRRGPRRARIGDYMDGVDAAIPPVPAPVDEMMVDALPYRKRARGDVNGGESKRGRLEPSAATAPPPALPPPPPAPLRNLATAYTEQAYGDYIAAEIIPPKPQLKKMLKSTPAVEVAKGLLEEGVKSMARDMVSVTPVSTLRDHILSAVQVAQEKPKPELPSQPEKLAIKSAFRSASSMLKREKEAARRAKFEQEKLEREERLARQNAKGKGKEKAPDPPKRPTVQKSTPPPPVAAESSRAAEQRAPKITITEQGEPSNAASRRNSLYDYSDTHQQTAETYKGFWTILTSVGVPVMDKIYKRSGIYKQKLTDIVYDSLVHGTKTVYQAVSEAERKLRAGVSRTAKEEGVFAPLNKKGRPRYHRIGRQHPYSTRSKGGDNLQGVFGRERLYWEDIPNSFLFGLPDPDKEAKKERDAKKKKKSK